MENNEIKIIETGNYMELVPLFKDSGLEVHLQGDRPKDFITCWRAEEADGRLAGGISIEYRGNEYVIGDLAVREDLRDLDIGTALMAEAMKRINSLGGKRVYLVAKTPVFYEKLGFTYLDEEEAPNIFSCKTCDSRGVSCNPEFMVWNDKTEV